MRGLNYILTFHFYNYRSLRHNYIGATNKSKRNVIDSEFKGKKQKKNAEQQ